MRTLLAALGLLIVSAGSLRADISDSGNLSLNGQAVIVGTMTVNGNAFSVGGSTLAATGGKVGIGTTSPATTFEVNGSAQFGSGVTKSTFTSTGLLKLTSSGIQWADGSTSTTSASGAGAGDVTASGTNSMTGKTSWSTTSSATVAGYNNWEVMVSSGDFAGVTAATITVTSYWGPVSSTTYRVELNMYTGGTAVAPYMMFGGDNGLNYAYIGRCPNAGGGTAVPSSTSARLIPLMETTTTLANGWLRGNIIFGSTYSIKNTNVKVFMDNSSNTIDECIISAKYTASQGPSSITIISNAATNLSGHWELWQGQKQQP